MKNIIPVMYEPVHAPVANSLAQLDLVDLPVHCIKILPMYLTRFFPFWFSLLTSINIQITKIKIFNC